MGAGHAAAELAGPQGEGTPAAPGCRWCLGHSSLEKGEQARQKSHQISRLKPGSPPGEGHQLHQVADGVWDRACTQGPDKHGKKTTT